MKNASLLVVGGLTLLTVSCARSPNAPSTSAASTPPQAAQTVAAAANPAKPSADPAKPSDESLTITFDPAQAGLSPAANAQLDGAARLYRDARPEVMIVAGHTDATGSEFGNLLLSARRAEAVKQGLVDRGVPADRLEVVAIGEAQPTPGVVPSRSAVVTWR
jgi:outer membrane protein OmpA-like peptidoglycan-associated protein